MKITIIGMIAQADITHKLDQNKLFIFHEYLSFVGIATSLDEVAILWGRVEFVSVLTFEKRRFHL